MDCSASVHHPLSALKTRISKIGVRSDRLSCRISPLAVFFFAFRWVESFLLTDSQASRESSKTKPLMPRRWRLPFHRATLPANYAHAARGAQPCKRTGATHVNKALLPVPLDFSNTQGSSFKTQDHFQRNVHFFQPASNRSGQ